MKTKLPTFRLGATVRIILKLARTSIGLVSPSKLFPFSPKCTNKWKETRQSGNSQLHGPCFTTLRNEVAVSTHSAAFIPFMHA